MNKPSGIRIRNWRKFQHFKDRRPPWIKVYRDLLDDRQWHALDGQTVKVLVMLWLIASEDNEQIGNLPDIETIAFRLRMTEKQTKQAITALSHWVETDRYQGDINMISKPVQVGPPETETETETETELTPTSRLDNGCFSKFWNAYPQKKGKGQALKAWKRIKTPTKIMPTIISAIDAQKREKAALKAAGQFCPEWKNPATWLNGQCWEDEPIKPDELPEGKKPWHF